MVCSICPENQGRYSGCCGILNSEALRAGVEQFQSQGQWGARHFDKYVFNLPIPKFDGNDPLHLETRPRGENGRRGCESRSGEEGRVLHAHAQARPLRARQTWDRG